MATLEELRAQLDGIDNEIIELYKENGCLYGDWRHQDQCGQ